MAQTTRTLLKRSVKAFQCFLYCAQLTFAAAESKHIPKSFTPVGHNATTDFLTLFPQCYWTLLQSSPFTSLNELFPRNSQITERPTQKFPVTEPIHGFRNFPNDFRAYCCRFSGIIVLSNASERRGFPAPPRRDGFQPHFQTYAWQIGRVSADDCKWNEGSIRDGHPAPRNRSRLGGWTVGRVRSPRLASPVVCHLVK
jgi:hypothetical protein